MAKQFEPKPSFFILMVKDYDRELCLPPVFMEYGNILQLNVKLRNTRGKIWNVKLEKKGEESWAFTEGWRKFAEDVGLGFLYCTVFQLAGESTFDVTVFGRNGLEVECMAYDLVSDSDEESVDIMGGDTSMTDSDPESCSSLEDPLPKKEVNGKGKEQMFSSDVEDISRPKVVTREKREKYKRQPSQQRTVRHADKEKCISYQKAKKFHFRNPYCLVFMQHSYLSGQFQLSFNATFAKENFPRTHGILKLCVGKNMTWQVMLSRGNSQPIARLGSGWQKFVQDNNLKVNDVCAFVANKTKPFVWDVEIFRN